MESGTTSGLYGSRFVSVSEMRRVMCNKIQKDELETGDHIYTLREADAKVHHGIYVSDKEVIHFDEKAWSGDHSMCPTDCYHPLVLSSCIDCFLSGGDLYRFEYGVNPAHFLAKCGRGCTLASADRAEVVEYRASFLLEEGYGACYRYINNGEDFAIFCKTGLLVVDMINLNRRCQIAYFMAFTAAVYLCSQKFVPVSFTSVAARILSLYCIGIFAPDIGARPNVIKVNKVHRLPQVDQILGYGGSGFQPSESYIIGFIGITIIAFLICLYSTFWCEPLQVWSWTFRVAWTQAFVIIFHWAVFQRRLISNKIHKEQLKPGDHIYTWRHGYASGHHGIYVGDGIGKEVIHVERGGDPIIPSGSSSSPSHSHQLDNCTKLLPYDCRIVYCSLDSFVDGGDLNLYKYGVDAAFLMAKTRGGTCTQVKADPTIEVVYRARFLQKHNGFGAYNLINNNCEDFAIYCKTGVVSTKGISSMLGIGQIASLFAVVLAIATLFCMVSPAFSTTRMDLEKLQAAFLVVYYRDPISLGVTFYLLYCMMRLIGDFPLSQENVSVHKMASYSKLADWPQNNFCHYTLSSLE